MSKDFVKIDISDAYNSVDLDKMSEAFKSIWFDFEDILMHMKHISIEGRGYPHLICGSALSR